MRTKAIGLIVLCTLAVSFACDYRLDTERNPLPRGTFGEELHRVIQADLRRLQPAKSVVFGDQRDRFVRAIDALLPDALLPSVNRFSQESLSFYDEGLIQRALRPLACELSRGVGADQAFLDAVWYLRHPVGYGLDQVVLPLVRRLASQPDATQMLIELFQLFLAHDGLDDHFLPSDEDATFRDLLSDLHRWLHDRVAEPADSDGTWSVFLDWLLSEDQRLFSPERSSASEFVVRTDERGRALVAKDTDTRQVVAPFADLDQDGLADLNRAGEYIDANRNVLNVPAPFDVSGLRSRVDGNLMYQYTDLSQSIMAAILSQLEPLVNEGLLWDLPTTLPTLLGPLVPRADSQGEMFAGYEASQSPLYAAVHAILEIVDYPRLPNLIEVLGTIFEQHEANLARLVQVFENVSDIADSYPDVSLMPNNRLFDDLVGHVLELVRRGYLLEVLKTANDPDWRQLQPGLAELIRYRSVSPEDWDFYDDYDSQEDYLLVRQPMDFALSDLEYENRSNLQRGVHLIYDTNGASHTAKILGIDVPFEIEDMLAFYLDSTARLAQIPGWAKPFILEFSSTEPTTEEINRFMVNNHTVIGNPKGNSNNPIREFNGESLLAFEFTNALDGFRPFWSTLVRLDRDRERSGTRVLADLLAAIHPHYSCNSEQASVACAHLRLFEPMLLEILDNTDLFEAILDFVGDLVGKKTASGYDVLEELVLFAGHLLEPDGTLTSYNGSTSVIGQDGLTPVYPISRIYLLLDAMRVIDRAIENDPKSEAAFRRALDHISDRFFKVEAGQEFRFANATARFLLIDLMKLLGQQTLELQDRLSSRIDEIRADFKDILMGRVLPRAVKAWKLVADHPSLAPRFEKLFLDLLASEAGRNLSENRRLFAWLLQHLQVDQVTVPIGYRLARLLDPAGSSYTLDEHRSCIETTSDEGFDNQRHLSQLIDLGLKLLQVDVRAHDGRQVPAHLIQNATRSYPDSDAYPLLDLLDILADVHRLGPSSADEYSIEDMKHMLQQVSDFLLDDKRGLERLYVMIERRDGF